MTTWEKMKKTASNVIHANENAKKAEEYKRKAKRNAVIGGGGIVATLAASVLVAKKHTSSIRSVYDKSVKDLSMQLEEMHKYITDLPEKIPEEPSVKTGGDLFNNFEEVEDNND